MLAGTRDVRGSPLGAQRLQRRRKAVRAPRRSEHALAARPRRPRRCRPEPLQASAAAERSRGLSAAFLAGGLRIHAQAVSYVLKDERNSTCARA